MLDCCILDDYQNCAKDFADWNRLSSRVTPRFITEYLLDEASVATRVGAADILIIMRERTPITRSLLARLPHLKLLITSGMRNAAIDIAACRERGIIVCGTDSFSEPPVELTWALILAIARGILPEANALKANGPWQSSVGIDLKGATLGLLGFGKIGVQVARIGKAFGMVVQAWSPNLSAERTAAEGVALAPTKETLLRAADFVSIHLVLGERSRGLIDAAALAAMKPTAFLVNTSRAAIVDGAALLQCLHAGGIAGAASDVHEREPLPADSPWRTAPRFLGLPHLGYVTKRNYKAYFTQAVEDIEAWLAGSPMRLVG
ncbi:MAG TPA: D-2-hydroxyacid dehydrogenase family protein [Rhabdaerophilum sp.]|nr:D-2-hydroxyacid dehydrogenase family protein [Rhabdaerophilum sp.]